MSLILFEMAPAEHTEADLLVLRNLNYDIRNNIQDSSAVTKDDKVEDEDDDEHILPQLEELSKEGWVFNTWDNKDMNKTLRMCFVKPYLLWAQTLVRQDPDAVFVTHLIIHFTILLPSALYLYYNFHWWHGIIHTIFAVWNAGPFTLLLHNHIHGNGIFKKEYWIFDLLFPYIVGPLMGHTWDSYYNHHVKMHHVEGNGPGDLSSTIRYQRDEPLEFLRYLGNFLLKTPIQLPIYFYTNKKYVLAAKAFVKEAASIAIILTLTYKYPGPGSFTLFLPYLIMRIGMMLGNWGQHCLVDNIDPTSDFRSSITIIDIPSNRHCFNDGYHTSHHLNPKRHWKAHPAAFLKAKSKYQTEGALTFVGIDYLEMTYRTITKDFDTLAKKLVPMGEQIAMSHEERVELLRSKTRRFTEEEIEDKFLKGARHGKAKRAENVAERKAAKESEALETEDVVGEIRPVHARTESNAEKLRRSSISLVKEVVGETSGASLNHDLLSQRL